MISMGSSQWTKARWKENFWGAIRQTEQWGWKFESLKLVAFTQNASNNKSQPIDEENWQDSQLICWMTSNLSFLQKYFSFVLNF